MSGIRNYITERIIEVRLPSGRKVLKSTIPHHKVILTQDVKGRPTFREVSKIEARASQKAMKGPAERHLAAVKGVITKARFRERGLYDKEKGQPSKVAAYKRGEIENQKYLRKLRRSTKRRISDIKDMKQYDSQAIKDIIRQGR